MTDLPETSKMLPMGVRDLHVEVRMEGGSFWATVEEFPGVFATGDNLQELRESLAEGIALMLALPGAPAPVVRVGDLESGTESVAATTHLVCA